MQGGGETGNCRGAALHVCVGGGTGGSSEACKEMRKREIAGEQDCVYVGGGGNGSSEACKGVGKQGNAGEQGCMWGGVRLSGGIS